MTAAIAWYERVMQCELLYRADEIGWCELKTPMAGVNIGLSEVESVTQGGGATNVFEVADIDAAKAHLDAEGVRQAGQQGGEGGDGHRDEVHALSWSGLPSRLPAAAALAQTTPTQRGGQVLGMAVPSRT